MYVVSQGVGSDPYSLRAYDFASATSGPTTTYGVLFGTALAVDADDVYGVTERGGIVVLGKHGSVVGTAPGTSGAVAGAACGVAWADASGIHWTGVDPAPDLNGEGLLTSTVLLVPGAGPVINLISDGTNLYWTDNGTGAIGKVPLP